MKNLTKATGVAALIGGAVAAAAAIVGAIAKSKDNALISTAEEFDELDENNEGTTTDTSEETENTEPALEGEVE